MPGKRLSCSYKLASGLIILAISLEHARQLHAAGNLSHFFFGKLVNLLHSVIDSCQNHILQHFYILGIYSGRIDFDGFQFFFTADNNGYGTASV